MNQMEELGKRVRDARLAKKWSVVEAAQQAGIARDTWKKVEAGESVQDTKRRAAMDAVGVDDGIGGWVPVPQEDIDTRPIDPDDPMDQALESLQRAAAALVQAENDLDTAARRWHSNHLLGERVREELTRRGRSAQGLTDAELHEVINAVGRPTPAEVAEAMAWGALHDPREWTRYEMALIEYVFDDYPGDVRRGSSYADLGPFRDRVERLRPVRARDVGPDVAERDGHVEDSDDPAITALPLAALDDPEDRPDDPED